MRTVLLSMSPEFADAILDGRKTVEFRRRPLASDVDRVVIYATRPTGRIVGVFDVRDQLTMSPAALWHQLCHSGGITEDAYCAYFTGASSAYGIRIASTARLSPSLSLDVLGAGQRPPQSFRYLTDAEADVIYSHVLNAAA